MTDLMTFPNTVEEFMEKYKIVDKEQVYTNGAELVPIFRMKQWFEHLPTADVRENVHGRWIVDEDGNIECSVCGHHGVGNLYCERCGARMDEGDLEPTEEDWYKDGWRDEWDERKEE